VSARLRDGSEATRGASVKAASAKVASRESDGIQEMVQSKIDCNNHRVGKMIYTMKTRVLYMGEGTRMKQDPEMTKECEKTESGKDAQRNEDRVETPDARDRSPACAAARSRDDLERNGFRAMKRRGSRRRSSPGRARSLGNPAIDHRGPWRYLTRNG
jgi:hypothetical protein